MNRSRQIHLNHISNKRGLKVFTSIDDYSISEEYEDSKIGKKFPDEEDYYWAENELAEKPYFFYRIFREMERNILDNIDIVEDADEFTRRVFAIKSKREPEKLLRLGHLHICILASFFIKESFGVPPVTRNFNELKDFFDNDGKGLTRYNYVSSDVKALMLTQYYSIIEFIEKNHGFTYDPKKSKFVKIDKETESNTEPKQVEKKQEESTENKELDW